MASTKSKPKTIDQDRLAALTELTDAFCDAHLDEDYKQMCREMAELLCEHEPSAARGKPASWAAGIVNALGVVNFLSDPETKPFMRMEDVARGFGVSEGTMYAKARIIRDGAQLHPFHPDWCVSSLVAENPMIWMLEVDGVIVDIRSMPRDVQVAAYEQGLIPYIPADQGQGEAPPLRLIDESAEATDVSERPPIDPKREDRIEMEIVVDAYNEDEQAIGWYCHLENHLQFPFRARCTAERVRSPLKANDEVEITGMAPDEECRREMFVMTRVGKDRLAIPLSQVTPLDVDDATRTAVEDWHYWVERGYQF